MHVPERSREELLDALTDVTRARDLLADTADRLIRERDEARAALDHPQRGAVSPERTEDNAPPKVREVGGVALSLWMTGANKTDVLLVARMDAARPQQGAVSDDRG